MQTNFSANVMLTGGMALLLAGGVVLAQAPGSPQSMGQQGQTMGQPGRAGMPNANPTIPQPDTTQMRTKVNDKQFVHDAAMGGLMQVELGRLAVQKGATDAVKQFGQKMVDDHTKANEGLKKLASAESINVPDSLDSKHESQINKLSKLSGAAFDKAYIKDEVKDHEKDVHAFQDEAQNGSQAAVKEFASKTLPTLQEHLAMAKDLKSGKSISASADRSQQQ
ncbi:MAG TPA: DUF4142 domain-containing protein [Bryobacteraceae bacterium]|nr:DUF4142 domain-containing protein [Bryobacteraceae bacterium]